MAEAHANIHEFSMDELNGLSGGTTGGISITHGGGNMNVAKGPLSEADTVLGRGRVITNGGGNTNLARGFATI